MEGRGGGSPRINPEIACHCSQDHAMVTRCYRLYSYPCQLEVSTVIFLLSRQVFQKFSRDRQKIIIFRDRKMLNWLFFNFFKTKVSNFVSISMTISFEVYYIFVAQKLKILENVKQFFSRLDLGHFGDLQRPKFDLSNLNRISNFSFHMKYCLWTKMKIRKL